MARPLLVTVAFALLVLCTASLVRADVSEFDDGSDAVAPALPNISDLCSVSPCRRFPATTPKAWPAPNVIDRSWIPSRWCSGSKCATGRSYTPFTTVLNNVAVGRLGMVFDATQSFSDPLVVNAESWDLPVAYGETETVGHVKTIKKAAHFITRFSQNYYHFLIESLPRLFLLSEELAADPSIQIITHSSKFAIDILTRLGYGDRLVETGAVSYEQVLTHPIFQVEELHYASGFSMYSPSAQVIEQIRKALNVQVLPESERNKIVFVSRRGNHDRQVENEEELIETLRATFPAEEVVVFESESLDATIQLFQQAKMIIGAHGAGLTNAIFAAPGTKVVEILFTTEPITLYWRLASELSQEYWAVPVPQSSWKSSMLVPSVELLQAVGRALGLRSEVATQVSCKAGHFFSQTFGTCQRCAPGFMAQADHCRICPSGTFSNARSSACIPCQAASDTWVWGLTYEPRFERGLHKNVGASAPSSCISRSRAARALSGCDASFYGYGTIRANARVTGDDRQVAFSNSTTNANPRVNNLSWFKDVPLNETHTFVITNRDSVNPLFISDVVIDNLGGRSVFTVSRNPDTIVAPGLSTSFSITYAAPSPSAGNGDVATVQIKFCDGFNSFAAFRVRGTTVTIPLELTPDTYTTTWDQVLSGNVLANDVSFQGPLTASFGSITSVTVPTAMVTSRAVHANVLNSFPNGTFTLTFDPLFSGYVTFSYTATNAFTSASTTVNVTVLPVSSGIVCPGNISVEAPVGTDSTLVAWDTPSALYNATVIQTAGPAPNSAISFFTGPVTISYLAQSRQGLLASRCSFTVRVSIRPPSITCPAPVSATSTTCSTRVTFNNATAVGYRVPASLQATTPGPSPQVFPVGNNVVNFTVVDGVGQRASCLLIVSVTLARATFQFDQVSGYPDADKDGFGAVGSRCTDYSRDPNQSLLPFLPPNQVLAANNLDCDDTNPLTNPASNEICDGEDNNCNGLIDEGRVCSNNEKDKPLEAAPVPFRPVEALDDLPSLPPTIVTIQKPFTIPVYTGSLSSATSVVPAVMCMLLLVAALVC